MGMRREPDFFKLVKKNIEKIREQGETPRSDLASFDTMDKYVCDLCKASAERAGLIQCSFCGRWVCREGCFDREDVSCLNCHGVIRLLRESQNMDLRSKRKSVLLDERKRVLREELRYQTKRDDAERKRKIQEIEFESEKREKEHKRRLKDIEGEKGSQHSKKGVLHAIKKMKKMRKSDDGMD